MSMFALEFPPISHLIEWKDILFKGNEWFALNKIGILTLVASGLTLVLFFVAGARSALVPRGVQNVAESVVEFIQTGIVDQTLGEDGKPFLPFLTSIFCFVFFCNIPEVIPFVQMPATARMAIPFVLALIVWFVYNGVGIAKQGFGHYLKNSIMPPGVPKALLPLVMLIEFISRFFVTPFSLAVRLFANMLAGHLLLVTFSVLSAALFSKTLLVVILPLPAIMLVLLTAFEILVALLQAFIFTILTAVYIGGSLHPEH